MNNETLTGREFTLTHWTGKAGMRELQKECSGDLSGAMKSLLRQFAVGNVCEIGCGLGRVASVFDASRYVGLDIHSEAVTAARQRFPQHDFRAVKWEDPYPLADTYIFYTVLLHVADDEIQRVVSRCRCKRVVIYEGMDTELRETGINWHRSRTEYQQLFGALGMEEIKYITVPIARACRECHFMVLENKG